MVNFITALTRRASNNRVDRNTRYEQILGILGEGVLTAKEIAVEMKKRKYTPTNERNFAAPRLTEMVEKGIVRVIGKKHCSYTNRTVAIYKKVY